MIGKLSDHSDMAEKNVEVFVRTDDVGQNRFQGYQQTTSCHLAPGRRSGSGPGETCWKRVRVPVNTAYYKMCDIFLHFLRGKYGLIFLLKL